MILFAAAVVLLTGLSLVCLLRLRPATGAGLLGYAFFLGVLGLALWTCLLLFLRIPFNTLSLPVATILVCVAAAWKGDLTVLRVMWPRPTWAMVPVLLSTVFALVGALSWHEMAWDGEVFYALKARSIAFYGVLCSGDFAEPGRIHMVPKRPLLLSAIYADFYLLAGSGDHRVLRIWFALLHLATLGVLYERARPSPFWLAVYAWIPALWHDFGGVFTGMADSLLAVLFLLVVDALRRREWGLAVFSMTVAVLLKEEAWAFLVALGFATLLTVPRDLGRLALVFSLPCVAILAWILVSRDFVVVSAYRSGQFSPANFVNSIPNWPLVLQRMSSEMLKPKHWGLFWVIGLAGVGILIRHANRSDVRWLLVIFLQFLAYVAVETTWPAGEIRNCTRIQGMRLMLHLAPLLWMWLSMKYEEVRGREPPPAPV